MVRSGGNGREAKGTDAVETSDYIIVGAGSAGCVLANRLSADPAVTVTLVEAGGSDLSPWIKVPIGYGVAFHHPRINWRFTTEPVPGLGGRTSYWPRGKALGGSSSINAMVWVRGQREDFDGWADLGNPGWSYDDLLPHMREIETDTEGDPAIRGTDGPVTITRTARSVHPLTPVWLKAAEAAGHQPNPDYNGASQEGVGLYQVNTRRGIRNSAATAFLNPAKRRRNLRIVTGATVNRVTLDGARATGIEILRNGRPEHLAARREVILSAGSVGSPLILERSGIGDPAVLGAAGIDVARALPGVGRNLQDHLGYDNFHEADMPTLNQQLGPLIPRAIQALRYVLTRGGPMSLSVNQAGGFVRTDPGRSRPNLQLYFTPASYTKPIPGKRRLTKPDPWYGVMLGLSNCHPKSRGELHVRSADPSDTPLIRPNYFSDPADMEEMVAGARLIRRIAEQPPLAGHLLRRVLPGPECESDAAIAEDIRNRAWTVFHPCGTCRMGPDSDPGAVVDARLRVRGVSGLRVADASIFPAIPAGNINAPSMMTGAKAAALILEDAKARNAG